MSEVNRFKDLIYSYYEKCKGCAVYEGNGYICYFIVKNKYKECPCQTCVVKTMCTTDDCPIFGEYCKEIKLIEKEKVESRKIVLPDLRKWK